MNKITLILPFLISIIFNEDKKFVLLSLRNNSDSTLYVKDIFKYFRYDRSSTGGLSECLLELEVGGKSKHIDFKEIYHDKNCAYYNILDSSSYIYSNIKSTNNKLVYFIPDFDEIRIVRKSPLIPMAPHSYYLFAIPTSEYLFHKRYYRFECSDLKDSTDHCSDSLFISATAAVWYSDKNSGKLKDFKKIEVKSDSLWFRLKD